MKKIVVAVDGPAGAGKGTISKALAEKFNLAYMDTGTVFRAVAYLMLKDNISTNNKDKAIEYAKKLGKEVSFDILKSEDLRSGEVGLNASKVAAVPEVRKILLDCQVSFAKNSPKDKHGSILDGRDIGTVVCPYADVKLYITASPEVRAERRIKDLIAKGEDVSFEKVLEDVKARDARDMERTTAPLKPADDAIIIDTNKLSREEVLELASRIISNKA